MKVGSTFLSMITDHCRVILYCLPVFYKYVVQGRIRVLRALGQSICGDTPMKVSAFFLPMTTDHCHIIIVTRLPVVYKLCCSGPR